MPTCFVNIVFGTWVGWTLLSYYAMFHFAKQPFGLLCIYKADVIPFHPISCDFMRFRAVSQARQGERGAFQHQMDYWTCMAGARTALSSLRFLGAALPLLLWHCGEFEGFSWFGGEDEKCLGAEFGLKSIEHH